MGCQFSCSSSPSSFECVRIVHINGYVEDYLEPTTVGQVKRPKLVLCSSLDLMSLNYKPLRPEELLEPGRLYFLLPHSVFQSDSSPAVMASLVARLTTIAKKRRSAIAGARSSGTRFSGQESPDVLASSGRMSSCRARSWKPVLDTIGEVYSANEGLTSASSGS